MSFLNRLFKKETPSSNAPPPVEPLYLLDYATFAAKESPPLPHCRYAMFHLDFKHVFPYVWWASQTIYRPENPSGFSLKVLTVRNEPSGEIECIFLQEMFDGGRFVIEHFKVPPDVFHAIEDLVRDLETRHSTKFVCRDVRNARTEEDFKRIMGITGGQPPPLP